MIRELFDGLTTREQRVLCWSAAAAAAALWLSAAWADPWVLLLVPMIGGWFLFLVRRSRRLDPMGHADADDDLF